LLERLFARRRVASRSQNNREKMRKKNRREGRFVGRRAALLRRRASCADSLCFV